MSWYYRDFFPRSTPRAAKGGIKAQTKRGAFGSSWWAKRWIEVLESFNIGARLSRGRSYARQGQVLSIEVDKGKVAAQVQGSRPEPYAIKIAVKTLTGDEWRKAAAALLKRLGVEGKALLVDVKPEDRLALSVRNIEGVRLLPSNRISARDVMDTRRVVLTQAALEKLQDALG